MSYDPNAFPQDQATGLEDTIDWNDAGGFAWIAHNQNATGYVVDGFEIDVDWGNGLFDIYGGVAELYQEATWTNNHADEGGDPEKELGHVSFRVQRGPSVDRNLADGINYVYVALDQTENNTVFFQDNTTATPPPEPYLLIAEIDTNEQTVVYRNPNPSATVTRQLITTEK